MTIEGLLAEELAYFKAHRAELLQNVPGKFALIKQNKYFGSFDDAESAYVAGVRQFGTEPFLIQQVLEEDVTYENPALYFGLTHADP